MLRNTDHSLFSNNSWPLATPIIFAFHRHLFYVGSIGGIIFYSEHKCLM